MTQQQKIISDYCNRWVELGNEVAAIGRQIEQVSSQLVGPRERMEFATATGDRHTLEQAGGELAVVIQKAGELCERQAHALKRLAKFAPNMAAGIRGAVKQ